jgi:predicted transcriptional regulator
MTDISKTEYEVLEAIWQQYPTSAIEIVERLNQQKPWHEKTVKTLINRMVKKGAIGFNKEGRQYFYYPQLEREAYQISESSNIINRLFGGKVAPLVAGFAKNKQLTQSDVTELKSLIEQWEKEND